MFKIMYQNCISSYSSISSYATVSIQEKLTRVCFDSDIDKTFIIINSYASNPKEHESMLS